MNSIFTEEVKSVKNPSQEKVNAENASKTLLSCPGQVINISRKFNVDNSTHCREKWLMDRWTDDAASLD